MRTCIRRLSIISISIVMGFLQAFSYGNVSVNNAVGVDEEWSECPIYYLPDNAISLLLSFSTVDTAHWLWINGEWNSSYDNTTWGYKETIGSLPLTQFAYNQYYHLQMYDGDGVRSMATSNYPAKKVGESFYILRYKDYNGASFATGTKHTLYFPLPGNTEISHDNGITWNSVDGNTRLYEATEINEGTVLYRKQNGSNYSSVVKINWIDVVPDQILTQIDGNVKTVDESVCLTLDITPNETYTYQWNHKGSPIEGANENSYVIDKIKVADAGAYSCTVSNAVSSVTSEEVVLKVNKAQQNIAFDELEVKTCGDEDIILPETTDKGLTILYQSINEEVASVKGNILKIKGAGETVIVASQPGDENYLSAATVSRKLLVNKKEQSIDFPDIPAKTYGDLPFLLPETTNEGLIISYNSLNTKVATIDGNKVTIHNAGSTEIIASQTGDATHYNAATVSQTLVVNRAPQKISFEKISTKTYGDAPVILNSVSDKGLPITYTTDADIINIEDNKIIIIKPGIANITAVQEGNENYLPAESISQSITINKAPQTIFFDKIPELTFGDAPFTLPKMSDKGLNINYTLSDETIAKIEDDKLIICGAGKTEITATQDGNEYYMNAIPVTHSVVVLKAYQNLVFDKIADHTFGDDPFELSASAETNNTIRYESSNPNIATINGNIVEIVGAGQCHITAYADGDNNYYDASPVSQQLNVNKASQIINFDRIADKTYGDAPFILSAFTSTGKELSYQSDNSKIISVSGNIATIRGAGSVILRAVQSGDDNYLANSSEITIKVNKATLIANADNKTRLYGDDNPELTITYSGFVNGDGVAELKISPIAITDATLQSNVGNYEINIESDLDPNYSIISQKGILSVEKAPLDIIAVDASRLYGDSNPDFSYKIKGFRNGDDERDLYSTPYVYTNAKSTSKVGTYEILVDGSDARNYILNYIAGKLQIEKAPLEAKLLNCNRIYGDDNNFIIKYKGFKNSDDESVIISAPKIMTTADINSNVGNYTAVLNQGEADNYYFTYCYEQPDKAIVCINKAELKIKAEDKSILVGDRLPIFTMLYEGFRNGDSEYDLDKYPYISAPDANIYEIGEYPIILEGGYDNNYEFKLINGILKVEGSSGINSIVEQQSTDKIDVFTLSGLCLFHNESKDILKKLSPGMYIVREGNTTRKIIIK